MRRKSFLSQVEAALWAVGGGGEASVNQVAAHLGLATPDRRAVRRNLNNLARDGRAERLRLGWYLPVKRQPGAPLKKEIMWSYLRARGRVTKEELMRAADASAGTVENWLASMERLGLVKNEAGPGQEGIYRLVQDPVVMPGDDLAEKERGRRGSRKAAMAKLDSAFATVATDCPGQGEGLRAIAEARLAVSQMEEE